MFKADKTSPESEAKSKMKKEVEKKKALVKIQLSSLHSQLQALRAEWLEIDQQQKDFNRICHDIKHEMIELNPKGGWDKEEIV